MASPLSLLLFGVIAGVLAENENSNSHPFNNGAVLPDAIKKPLSPYLNGINIETNFHEELTELSKINPVLSGVMEELHENIIAMESVLKAKYLFFTEIIEISKKKKDNIGSDDPASILGKALYSVPEERREILADFLNFSDPPVRDTLDAQMHVVTIPGKKARITKQGTGFENRNRFWPSSFVIAVRTGTHPQGCLLKIASPLSLLLFGVIAGVLADYEDQDTTRLFFSNDGTALPGTSEDLLSRSSNGMYDEVPLNNVDRNKVTFPLPTNFGEELAELSKTNPMLRGSMEELYKTITAMESDLKAKYLFFGEIIEIFKKKKDIIGSDDPASILEKALDSIPEERRKILVDFLNFNEHLENERAFQMSVHTNVSAGTKTSSTCSDTPRSDSEVELRKSLKTIETILNVVINSLSYQLQQKFLLNALVYRTRLTITSCNPLTFADIKPIFRALSETSLALYYYVENITRAREVDLADIALYDILRKLCDIATKLNTDRGELLKSFFNYHLGAGIKFTGKTIWEHFDSIGKVASAAEFF